MATTPNIYAPRIRYIELLEREKSNITELKIYRDGVQVVPTSATYTLVRPDGVGVVQDIAANIDGDGTLTYTHPSNHFPSTITLGEGYIQTWTTTISTKEYTFRRAVAVVLRRLYPTVSDADLEQEYSDLSSLRPSSLSSYQTYIDSSWFEILRRIRRTGMGYEYLVLTPESFHDALLHLSLYKIFRDFHSSLGQSNARYFDIANSHYSMYQQEYSSINFLYDVQHEDQADDPDTRTRGMPVIYTSQISPYRFLKRR